MFQYHRSFDSFAAYPPTRRRLHPYGNGLAMEANPGAAKLSL
jgi:hypothetical protein